MYLYVRNSKVFTVEAFSFESLMKTYKSNNKFF